MPVGHRAQHAQSILLRIAQNILLRNPRIAQNTLLCNPRIAQNILLCNPRIAQNTGELGQGLLIWY